METIYRPMTKQFSYIQGLQPSYTLVYSMDPAGPGECWLTLCRTGCHRLMDSMRVLAKPEECYGLLRYLYENAVQPEVWRDVVSEAISCKVLGLSLIHI